MNTITQITTEVYETKNDDFCALIVFMDPAGELVSHTKTFHADRQDAIMDAFALAFAGRDYKRWSQATYHGQPGKRTYMFVG